VSASNAGASSVFTDREIIATRLFDAPRELVFKMWTDPQHIVNWWGPRGFTTTIHEMDVKPGGVWRFVMHGPDGVDYQNKNVYVEVVKPERLVFDHVSGPRFRMSVAFADRGGKTEVSVQMLFESTAERDQTVNKFGAIEGLQQTLDRLTGALAAQRELVITRVFDAPRELVFKAWTDAERMKRWWGPKGFTNPVCELDVRPRGAIRIHMRAPDGTVYPMGGVYQEIVPPERLVFTSAALDDKGNQLFENLNTITFVEHAGKTKLTLRTRVLKTTPAAAQYLAGMEQGWNLSLDRLAEEVTV
jgi:uncharacterized protein YndB with AHSA1/START domain